MLEFEQDYMKMNINKETYVPSGIYAVDHITSGYCKGEVTILTATTGNGKSIIALSSAVNMSKQGSKILYISLENSVATEYTRLSNLREQYQENENNLCIYVNDENKPIDLEALLDIITNACEKMQQYPDAIFIDSIDYISLEADTSEGSKSYNVYGNLIKAIRAIGKHMKDTAIILTAQLNRGAYTCKAEDLHSGYMADSIKISQVAHDIWAIKKTEDGKSVWKIVALKHRGELLNDDVVISMVDPVKACLDITHDPNKLVEGFKELAL